jgi:hypothetical protein
MKRITYLLLLAASVLPSGAVHAATSDVTTKIEFLTPDMLPGVPAAYVIRVVNNGSRDAHISSGDYFVRDAQGIPQILKRSGIIESSNPHGIDFQDDDGNTTALQAGKSLDLYHLEGDQATWINNPFIPRPGTTTLSIKIVVDGEEVLSDPAQLHVRQPAGDDLEVWQLMEQHAGATGWRAESWETESRKIAPIVFRDHPRSRYTAYFAGRMPGVPCPYGSSGCFDVEPSELALTLNPPSPIRDALLLDVGDAHVRRGEGFFSIRDIDGAATEMSLAKPYLEELLRTTSIPQYRVIAEKAAARLGSRSELGARLKAELPTYPAPLRVKPFVDCIDVAGDTIIARFGYTNPNVGGKEIQPGSGNRFDPAPVDRGQPRWFVSGTKHEVSGASAPAKKGVTWQLDGQSASATPDFPTRCSGTQQPTLPLRVFVDCAKADGPNMIARFGYENPNPFPVQVAFGPTNQVSTGAEKDQPTIFEHGSFHDVLTVKAKNASSVTWTLDRTTAVAYATKSAQCPSNLK